MDLHGIGSWLDSVEYDGCHKRRGFTSQGAL